MQPNITEKDLYELYRKAMRTSAEKEASKRALRQAFHKKANYSRQRAYLKSPEGQAAAEAAVTGDAYLSAVLRDPEEALLHEIFQEYHAEIEYAVSRGSSISLDILQQTRTAIRQQQLVQRARKINLRGMARQYRSTLSEEICLAVQEHYRTETIYWNHWVFDENTGRRHLRTEPLEARLLDSFLEAHEFEPVHPLQPAEIQRIAFRYQSLPRHVLEALAGQHHELREILEDPHYGGIAEKYLLSEIQETLNLSDFTSEVCYVFNKEVAVSLLGRNPRYADMIARYSAYQQQKAQLGQAMLRQIPDKYIDLYPLARRLKRRFILHIGPTNSGKTYHAMRALRKASHGIYLGPLRLLAYEQYEMLSAEGFPCSLVTGEEEIHCDYSLIQCSTVEIASMTEAYDIAVIDEAQMIADPSRGGAWTSAILGLCAAEIHVCAAPSAEPLLKKLIHSCGDTYVTHHYSRKVPLLADTEPYTFPQSVHPKDALIVFSRRDVHAVAAELQQRRVKCSIIYGNLPYDVRHEEARKFRDGETDVIVSTDAIGMGLNLPVKRIVFLQGEKFDGTETRSLLPMEVQQIAGRAGRFKIFPTGYYCADGFTADIQALYETEIPPIEQAVIAFPESLITLDVKLSDILNRWNEIPMQDGFIRADCSREIRLAQMLEALSDDKPLIYRFITIPFDEENAELLSLWQSLFVAQSHYRTPDIASLLPSVHFQDYSAENMMPLEDAFKVCDLLYFYSRTFEMPSEALSQILDYKNRISNTIMQILVRQKYSTRRCRVCGTRLPFSYPYMICHSCWKKRY